MSGIDRALEDGVRAGMTPGVVGMVAGRDGVRYAGAFGQRGVDDPAPMTVDTVFRLFSMSKAIGSLAALKLVEAGSLDLDAPVGDILPEFDALQVLDGFDGDTLRLRAPASRATVRQLATHTSGAVYEFWNADIARYLKVTGRPSVLAGTKAALHGYPLAFDPGARWDYGIGIDWLGQVVEAVSGQRIDAFCAEQIFAPLGMTDTAFECEGPMRARLAGAQATTPEGWKAIPLAPPPNPEVYGMGHCLYGTAPDYIRFLRMILNGGTLDGAQVLRPETLRLMTENQIGALDVTPMRTVMPPISADVDLFPGVTMKHSVGFVLNTDDIPGKRRAGSMGWAGVLNTHFWVDPASDVAAVLMMQHLPFVEPGALRLYDAFERAAYAA